MTREEAYIEGFCKAAEEHGVDPVALCKAAAGTAGLIGRAFGLARGYGSRLLGGRVGALRRSIDKLKAMKERQINEITGAGLSGDSASVERYGRGLDRINHSLGQLSPRLTAEMRAVRNARLGTAAVGTLGAGFTGGAMYNSFMGNDLGPEPDKGLG